MGQVLHSLFWKTHSLHFLLFLVKGQTQGFTLTVAGHLLPLHCPLLASQSDLTPTSLSFCAQALLLPSNPITFTFSPFQVFPAGQEPPSPTPTPCSLLSEGTWMGFWGPCPDTFLLVLVLRSPGSSQSWQKSGSISGDRPEPRLALYKA